MEELAAAVLAVHSTDGGASGYIVIDPCPFYAEGGGQVGDRGRIEIAGSNQAFRVTNTTSPYPGGVVCAVTAEEGSSLASVNEGQQASAVVDSHRRGATAAHHTATHLLHAALHQTLTVAAEGGAASSVQQAGSLVDDERLRFDFTWPQALSKAQLAEVERWVNEAAMASAPVRTQYMDKDDAKRLGARALFGEKYGDTVRVVDVPGFSAELCGGTHVSDTALCYPFKILSEGSVAAGTRRIEAMAGRAAVRHLLTSHRRLEGVADGLGCSLKDVENRLAQQSAKLQQSEQAVDELKRQLVSGAASAAACHEAQFGGCNVKVHVLPKAAASDPKLVRERGAELLAADPAYVHIVLCEPPAASEEKEEKKGKGKAKKGAPKGPSMNMLVFCCPDTNPSMSASSVFKSVVESVSVAGGRGGGTARVAQGQLPMPQGCDAVEDVLQALQRCAQNKMSS